MTNRKFEIISLFVMILLVKNIYAKVNNVNIVDKDPQYNEKKEEKITRNSKRSDDECYEDMSLPPISLLTSFNRHDFFVGISVGHSFNCRYDFLLNILFYMRPYKKTAFEEEDENTYYQFKEERYVVGFNIEKYLNFSENTGVFFAAGAGYSFGDFKGSKVEANDKITPIINAGFFYGGNMARFKIGYQYIRTPYVPSNRGIVEVYINF